MIDFDQTENNETAVRPFEYEGHSFQIIRTDPFGFYRVSYKGEHPLSAPLRGMFTEVEKAVLEIKTWATNLAKGQEADVKAQEEIEDLEARVEHKQAVLQKAIDEAEAMAAITPKANKNGKRTT